jgi:hypothetical protein
MKYKDLVLISIIIGVLALATYYITIEAYTLGVLLSVIAFYTLIYVIVGVRIEKRSERELTSIQKVHSELIDECNQLEIDLAKQVKETDEVEKLFNEQVEVIRELNTKLSEYEDITTKAINDYEEGLYYSLYKTTTTKLPFDDKVPYIGMTVKVKYGQQIKITQISKILYEKPIKYRCAKCGSKKYLPSDFMELSKEEIEQYKELL